MAALLLGLPQGRVAGAEQAILLPPTEGRGRAGLGLAPAPPCLLPLDPGWAFLPLCSEVLLSFSSHRNTLLLQEVSKDLGSP